MRSERPLASDGSARAIRSARPASRPRTAPVGQTQSNGRFRGGGHCATCDSARNRRRSVRLGGDARRRGGSGRPKAPGHPPQDQARPLTTSRVARAARCAPSPSGLTLRSASHFGLLPRPAPAELGKKRTGREPLPPKFVEVLVIGQQLIDTSNVSVNLRVGIPVNERSEEHPAVRVERDVSLRRHLSSPAASNNDDQPGHTSRTVSAGIPRPARFRTRRSPPPRWVGCPSPTRSYSASCRRRRTPALRTSRTALGTAGETSVSRR
jgi:hypothetical protein